MFRRDGLDRLNSSINAPTNMLVSEEISNALQSASDHLPVFAEVILGDIHAGVRKDHGTLRHGSICISNCVS